MYPTDHCFNTLGAHLNVIAQQNPRGLIPTLAMSSHFGIPLPTPSLTPSPALSATSPSTYLDNGTSNGPGTTPAPSSFVDNSTHPLYTSTSTSALSTTGSSTSHLTAGGGIGVGVGLAVAAICLVSVLVLYIKRRRRHCAPSAPVHPLMLSRPYLRFVVEPSSFVLTY